MHSYAPTRVPRALMAGEYPPTGSSADAPPVIRVNVASNSLLVRANAKQYAMIESIVSRLDGAALAGSRLRGLFQ
jgi:type II secretory pathway component GspD/PulD (secretin)